jgi:hypothetical protein
LEGRSPSERGAVGLSFTNSFTVETYDKARLAGQKLSLAGFFWLATNPIGFSLDSIKTHGDTLVATNTLRYHNVLVNRRKQSFDVLHGFLFAESADRFYEVEIVYSPQTHDSNGRLSDPAGDAGLVPGALAAEKSPAGAGLLVAGL